MNRQPRPKNGRKRITKKTKPTTQPQNRPNPSGGERRDRATQGERRENLEETKEKMIRGRRDGSENNGVNNDSSVEEPVSLMRGTIMDNFVRDSPKMTNNENAPNVTPIERFSDNQRNDRDEVTNEGQEINRGEDSNFAEQNDLGADEESTTPIYHRHIIPELSPPSVPMKSDVFTNPSKLYQQISEETQNQGPSKLQESLDAIGLQLYLDKARQLYHDPQFWADYLKNQSDSQKAKILLVIMAGMLKAGVILLGIKCMIDFLTDLFDLLLEVMYKDQSGQSIRDIHISVYDDCFTILRSGFSKEDQAFLIKGDLSSAYFLLPFTNEADLRESEAKLLKRLNFLKEKVLIIVNNEG